MDTAVFIAQIAAVVYLAVGLGLLLNGDYYKKKFGKMLDNSALMYVGGVISLVVGFVVVTFHNVWVKDWTVLVTIIGWLALLKGLLLVVFPQSVNFFRPMFKSDNLGKWMLFPLILGLVFGYYGFLA